MRFREDFLFGVATAAYQIEGAANEDGRTPSIWDTFCRTPGKVYQGDTGDTACDHYHLYKQDVALMKQLGVNSYRFSISWPRIFPEQGKCNEKGIAFYRKLLNELKSNDIKACVTLYHWDLPEWAYAKGGWVNRECVEWFLEFAAVCFKEFGSMVDMWVTHNEPWCPSFLSYIWCQQAPGKTDVNEGLRVAHHLLLSHGMAVRLYRKTGLQAPIGIVLNISPTYAASSGYGDALAASNISGFINRWYLEPLFKGSYPFDIANLLAPRIPDLDFIQSDDFKVIGEACDFIGVNYYSPNVVQYDPLDLLLSRPAYTDMKKTDMGWDISPEGFVKAVEIVRGYTKLPIYITENGSAWQDVVTDGKVHDPDRVDYLEKHLESVSDMNKAGMNIAGYFAWSLMDNFEWSFGYSKRFGLVYVDFMTQERIKKDSYYRYQEIINTSRK